MSARATRDPEAAVRALLVEAEEAGATPPTKASLMKATGATDHQVRKVRAERKILAQARAQETGNDLGPTASDDEPDDDTEASTSDRAHADVNDGEPVARRTRFGRRRKSAQVRDTPGGGKAVAWVGFIFGSVVSVAANVLAAWIAPAHAPPGWHPTLAAQLGAAVWPLGLLLAVEVVSRTPRPRGFWGKLALFTGVGVVALGSAAISYGHIQAVLVSWAYNTIGATVGPLVIDGLMTVCGVAMLAKPVRTPDAPVVVERTDDAKPPAEPAPEPALPVSYAALSIANGQPIAPAGDAWLHAVARLAEPGDRG